MRSAMTAYSPGCRRRPPSTTISSVPAPETFAPRQRRKPCRSTISGSRAGLRITVTPWAPQAASMAFSVAPTLGMGRATSRPRSRGPSK